MRVACDIEETTPVNDEGYDVDSIEAMCRRMRARNRVIRHRRAEHQAMPGIDARRVPKRAVELLCRGRLLRRSEQRAEIPQFRVITGRSN